MAHLICKYFHLVLGQGGRTQILEVFLVKINVFDLKSHLNYVKNPKKPYTPLEPLNPQVAPSLKKYLEYHEA